MRLELGNVEYFGFKNWDVVYEGEVKNNQPNGKGRLIYNKPRDSHVLQKITL